MTIERSADSPAREGGQPVQPLRAFVVEDQPMVASTLIDVLTTLGITVLGHAYDVPAALAWLESGEVPDLVLIDLMLPSGPAYPVLDRLKHMPTATLLITGVAAEQIPAPYQHFRCLEKPFGVHALLEAITALVR